MTKYTFTTGTELIETVTETIEQAYAIIKAEYGCYLKIVKREKIIF